MINGNSLIVWRKLGRVSISSLPKINSSSAESSSKSIYTGIKQNISPPSFLLPSLFWLHLPHVFKVQRWYLGKSSSKWANGGLIQQILEKGELSSSLWPMETWEKGGKSLLGDSVWFFTTSGSSNPFLPSPATCWCRPDRVQVSLRGRTERMWREKFGSRPCCVRSHSFLPHLSEWESGASWTNDIAAFATMKWKEVLRVPAGARPLLGRWQRHLAQCPSTKWSPSAPSRCVASFLAASVHATWRPPTSRPNAHFPKGLRAWNFSSVISYLYSSSWCLNGVSDKRWGTTL